MSSERETNEEEALKKLGAVKSNYALIDLAASQIENRLLTDDEVMNDNPASFTNIFLENFGRLTSQSFYEQMMYKNEMTASTAIKMRSLVNKLKAEDIANIYAYPAHMTFVLGYNYDRLVELAKANGNQIVINKNCKFSMDGQEAFTLDHNIKIILVNPGTKNQNVYAIYDTAGYDTSRDSKLTEVNNKYITSQIFQYNGVKVFGMFVNARQLVRTENVINITSENPDFQITFEDQLYGFELYYKSNSSSKYVYKEGKFDGNFINNGYNFEIDNEEKTISFTFNRIPNTWSPVIGDEIKLVVFTTKGKSANFTIPNVYELYDQIVFEYEQDRDDPKQDCLVFTDPYISLKDNGATGGRDALSFNEIRSLVIQRGANSSILTPGDLERKANELGFAVNKIRSDVRCLEYRASGILESLPDIVSSRDSTISFNFLDIPLNPEVSNRLITPKMVFEMNKNNSHCEYVKDAEDYETYFDEFRDNIKNQYMFPYHIRFLATNEVKASIFNMNRNNDIYNLNFLYYNTNTNFESSILNLYVNRNTIIENINDIPKKITSKSVGYYDLSFQVTTSNVVISNLLDEESTDIVKYRLTIKDDGREFLVESEIKPEEIDVDNNTLIIHAYIRTDDAISNSNKLLSRDYSLQPVPFVTNPIEYYGISDKVSVKIYVIEKTSTTDIISSEYESILKDEEKTNGYFVSTVYGIDEIVLFEDYTDYFSLPSDISVSQKEYSRYESDVYKVYESDEYVTNENGEIVTELVKIKIGDTYITTPVSKILHEKGSYVYKSNVEMSISTLKEIASIIYDDNEYETYSLDTLASLIKLDIGEMNDETLVLYLKKFLDLNYTIVDDDTNASYKVLKNTDNNEFISEEVKKELQNKLNEYRTKIIVHHAGDINTDGALLKNESYSAIIKKVPLYNRIYALGNGHEMILESYENLISNIKSLQTLAPDGASISLGIKNTSGSGDYEVFNMNTSSWQKIDDISLSFEIGVKYIDSASNDTEADSQIIVEAIRDYINTFDDISFGINTIFETVKDKLPSIEYMILYKINQYSPAEVQSIRKANGNSIVSDKLCVKQVVDIDNTDLKNGIVSFKPDITIRTIL